MRIVINQCYDELRRRKRAGTYGLWHQAEESPEVFSGKRPVNEREPEFMTQQAELARLLRTGIHTLPRPQRVTVVLRDVHELSYEEIAATTQTSLGTVKSRLNRGRRRLRRFLQARAAHLLSDRPLGGTP
jgi:RNA polymerase sigma-70 factor (ECF subfamily)